MSTQCSKVFLLILLSLVVKFGDTTVTNSAEWTAYKAKYQKTYSSPSAENNALYYYNCNKLLIEKHNKLYASGQRTFKLAENQWTDRSLQQFNALFPKTTPKSISYSSLPPAVAAPPASFDPRSYGYYFSVKDQGTVCNSGWAYATAKSIEAFQAMQIGDFSSVPLSAQYLIDCSGSGVGCKNQVPQTGFDYVTVYRQPMYWEIAYPHNNKQVDPGMCVPVGTAFSTVTSYANIADGADTLLKNYVGNQFPVVVEFNPTSFEFMHYSEGVFQQPATGSGSHFLTVMGYGRDPTYNLDYWLVQNSFGTTWGEGGLIRILRSASKPLTKSAIFPIE